MNSQYQWLDNSEQVAELNQQWSVSQPLFVDTEFMRERTYWPQLALVQIHNGSGNWLIDPKPLTDGEPLKQLLSRRPLVMHGCSEDLETFKSWPGFVPSSLEDTQVAGAFCGYDLQCGYQKMVESVHGVSLAKTATRTDWLRRPLSAEQLDYAVQDVIYLPGIYEALLEKLSALDRLSWWREECQRMLDDAVREADPEALWKQVKGAGSLDNAARRNLLVLARWRDEVARKTNLPRSFVLKDAELLPLCQAREYSTQALSKLGLHPSFLRKYMSQLQEQFAFAATQPIPDPLPGMPDPALRDVIKRLRQRVTEIAQGLEMTPEILGRRRWLEAMARTPGYVPEPLRGWRQSLVAEPLLEILE